MIKFIINIVKILNSVLQTLNTYTNTVLNKLSNNNNMCVTKVTHNENGRFLVFHLNNITLETHETVIRNIFTTLKSSERFVNFGFKKVIIIAGIINGEEFSFHHNVLIGNQTTFSEYYNSVKKAITHNYDLGYHIDVIPQFKVRVWNMDELSNKKIKITKTASKVSKVYQTKITVDSLNNRRSFSSFIKPIKAHNIDPTASPLSTMDIETMEFNGLQLPVAISLAYCGLNDKVKTKIFLLNIILFHKDHNKAIDLLWKQYFDFITDPKRAPLFKNIFVHNLGSFDGLFLYKALSNQYPEPEMVSTLIDDKNKFIQISLNNLNKITWKDSYRLFSVSLNDLCSVFNVPGKTSKYDPRFNTLDLFDNPDLLKTFIEYSLQDALSLYLALDKAQEIYLRDYSVDIAKSLSSSSLSLKIFRTLFQRHDIPILKGLEDSFIRKGYFGGHTDYYKAYVKLAKYYDVNSLYPFAMVKPMPHELIKFHNNMNNIKLDDFFGFCLAEITTPKNTLKPLLPYKYQGKTIYPTGTWIGVYFTEELKAVTKHGYQIKLIKGYEFSKIDLFTDYVKHFFDMKKNATGAARWLAKMHLNQLYGIFGRRKDLIETLNVSRNDLNKYLATNIVKSVIKINENVFTILIQHNMEPKLVKDLKSVLENEDIINRQSEVKSNVAIAAAVTAYGRIHMIPFILHPGTVYTDTDSIFSEVELDLDLIGLELGLMKDELKGAFIEEAYFLGIKQYGYWYTDSNNRIEQSVFAGITRNSLRFNEIKTIFNGETISKFIENRFYKSFKNLSITIKPVTVNIKKSNDKQLINNTYIPINIINLNHGLDNRNYFEKLKHKIIKLFKHYT